MSLSLHVTDLKNFFQEVEAKWPVFGPSQDKNSASSTFRFKKLGNFSELSLDYRQTIIPPRKYLQPASEIVFRFEKEKIFPPINKMSVLFGLNRVDAEGIFYLDELMLKPLPDQVNESRRSFLKIVVIDSRQPNNHQACDLYLQRVSRDYYLVFPYSEFGQSLVKGKHFSRRGEVGTINTRHLQDEVIYHPRLDQIVEESRNHPVWDRLAQECLACGVCSYTCPLCHCFETEDNIEPSKDIAKEMKGSRIRRWDSCLLPEFNKVTFHNFRPEIKDRIYNWYYHKFVRMPREYGFPGCVDCGRCIAFCPANINFREVLKELIEDDKRKTK